MEPVGLALRPAWPSGSVGCNNLHHSRATYLQVPRDGSPPPGARPAPPGAPSTSPRAGASTPGYSRPARGRRGDPGSSVSGGTGDRGLMDGPVAPGSHWDYGPFAHTVTRQEIWQPRPGLSRTDHASLSKGHNSSCTTISVLSFSLPVACTTLWLSDVLAYVVTTARDPLNLIFISPFIGNHVILHCTALHCTTLHCTANIRPSIRTWLHSKGREAVLV
jgi:hypothetical protein